MTFISSRRPLFWVLLSIISLAGILFTYNFFTRAFPIASVDLKVDRKQVLSAAQGLAQKYNWGPTNYRQAASFDTDSDVQTYVELEVGGSEAFNQMITGTLYSPFTWHVRHFKEGETNETAIGFKPDGTPYEFLEKIAESAPGAKLLSVQARTLAEEKAKTDWAINFNEYAIVESSQEVRPNGRIDHTFVYERPDILIGQGRYRLRLSVTGDKLTELNHFIKIPEGFSLRYSQMRSANATIGSAARIAMSILYILLGCCIGLFLLMRQGWVIWQQAALWSFLLIALGLLNSINSLPLIWMNYDTAVSAHNFLLQYSISSLMGALFMLLFYFLSITAAESLTRRAFGHQIQLWKLWSPSVASTFSVLGRTIGGYLIIGFDLAFVVSTYMITRTFFGWWLPSSPLIDPNILATYAPWFGPAVRSLQAGFWEECLFRAVPLSCAALIGQRFGKRNLFIVVGLVLQAVIFGAAHADYPTQPAYGRVVELIIPSLIFGGIYLVYGLMPGIISHFMFDLVLMAMPLFISSAPGSWIDQGAVIIWGAIPLLIVLYFRFRIGAWGTVNVADYNSSWEPTQKNSGSIKTQTHPIFLVRPKKLTFFVGVGITAVALWIFTTQFKQDAPPLNVIRSQAVVIAQQALAEKNLDSSWQMLPFIFESIDQNNRYIWQEGGKQAYQALVESRYIPTPQWTVRVAKFDGDLEDRAEEYVVFIAGDGNVLRVAHRLPEKRAGASLTEEQARQLVYKELNKKFELNKDTVKEISATPTKHPARLDWLFVFSNPGAYNFKDGNGQARISINISGDEITDIRRFVHAPEEWERNDRNTQSLFMIIQAFCGFLLMLLLAIMAIYALITSHFSFGESLYFFGFLFFLGTVRVINGWPTIIALFSTSEPWSSQVFRVLASLLIQSIVMSGATALILSMTHVLREKFSHEKPNLKNIVPAVVVGTLLAMISSGTKLLGPSLSPTWASFSSAGTYIPTLGTLLGLVSGFFIEVATLLVLLVFVYLLSNSWTKNKVLCSFILILSGLLITSSGIESITIWLLKGILVGIILLLYQNTMLRSFPALIIPTLATATCLRATQQIIFGAYPGATLGYILGIIVIVGLAWYIYRKVKN